MIADVNLTDPEIYKVLLGFDEVAQHDCILICQLRPLYTRHWKIESTLLYIPAANAMVWYSKLCHL